VSQKCCVSNCLMNPVIIEGVIPWLHKLLIGNVRFSGLLPSGKSASTSGLLVSCGVHVSVTWNHLFLVTKRRIYSGF